MLCSVSPAQTSGVSRWTPARVGGAVGEWCEISLKRTDTVISRFAEKDRERERERERDRERERERERGEGERERGEEGERCCGL